MSMRVPPFTPSGNYVTTHMTVSTVSGALQFDGIIQIPNSNQAPSVGAPPLSPYKARTVRLYNAGPGTVYFELCGANGDRTASVATGTPLAANASEKFTTGGATYVAAVTASGTATLYATPGEGL